MTATATTSTEIMNANAGTPPEKVVDMATGQGSETPTEPTVGTSGTPESPDKSKDPPAAEAVPPVPAEPSKLDKARAVARAKHEEAQRRIYQQAAAKRAQSHAEQTQTQLAHERARADAAHKELERLRDPLAALEHLEKVGLNPKVLAEKAVALNTPEARLRAEIDAKIEARTEAIKKDYEARLQGFEAERQQAAHSAAVAQAEQRFLQEAGDAETFPSVAHMMSLGDEWSASILEEAKRVIRQAAQRTGVDYTNGEVLAFLDKKYSKVLHGKSGEQKSNGANDAQRDAQNGTGANATTAAGSPRTLTNKTAQEKGSLPPNFDDLSPKEQEAALAALYRALRRT